MELEKIVSNDATDKGLISKIYKQLIQLNTKKPSTQVKMGRRPEQTFLQRYTDDQLAQEKMFNITIIIREMKIKTTMRYHLIPVRVAIINKPTNNKCWRGCGEKGTLLHCWWKGKLVQPLWKMVQRFLRKLNIEPPCDPAIPLLGIYPEKIMIRRDTCTPMFIVALFTIAKIWK